MNPLLVLWYNLQELWPPAPQWNTADIPDLRGKIFLVTGGNAGLGAFDVSDFEAKTMDQKSTLHHALPKEERRLRTNSKLAPVKPTPSW